MAFGAVIVLLLLLLLAVNLAAAIALVPLSKDNRVSQSKDHNIIAVHGEWRRVDLEKQYANGKPPPPFDDKHTRPDTSIVVLIAALRESRLADTLVSLFSNAEHPERIIAAVVQQNAPEDEDVVVEYCRKMNTPVSVVDSASSTAEFSLQEPHECVMARNNIRVHRMLASDAAGPVYARALGNTLVDFTKDDFCLQIDAHTVVVPQWDTLMLEDWGKANNEFAVLTTYPTNAKDLGRNTAGHWQMPHLCSLDGRRGVFMNSQAKACAQLDAPLLSILWAAGLSFSKCHAEQSVPNDVNLKGVFVGEEYSRGARLWTHGYDFYSNSRPFIGTYYGGEKGGKSHSWKTHELERSHDRLRILSKVPGFDSPEQMESLGKYQLGKRRTLEQYMNFSGIDPRGSPDHSKFVCAPVYVPWYDNDKDNKEEGEVQLAEAAVQDDDVPLMGGAPDRVEGNLRVVSPVEEEDIPVQEQEEEEPEEELEALMPPPPLPLGDAGVVVDVNKRQVEAAVGDGGVPVVLLWAGPLALLGFAAVMLVLAKLRQARKPRSD